MANIRAQEEKAVKEETLKAALILSLIVSLLLKVTASDIEGINRILKELKIIDGKNAIFKAIPSSFPNKLNDSS